MWWSKSSSSTTPPPAAADAAFSPNTHPYEQTSSSSADTPWRWPAPPNASSSSNPHSPTPDEENGAYNLSSANKAVRTKRETICGIRRKVFFMIIFGGVLVAVAAVAIGVGAGIAFSKKKKPDSNTTVLSTSNTEISCPANNNSIFQSPSDTNAYFRLVCGLDYPTSHGSVDISSSSVSSMSACIDLCADTDGCLGVSWEDPDSDDDEDEDESEGQCVLKKKVGNSVEDGDSLLALRVDNPNKKI